jgi:hypothetical protein
MHFVIGMDNLLWHVGNLVLVVVGNLAYHFWAIRVFVSNGIMDSCLKPFVICSFFVKFCYNMFIIGVTSKVFPMSTSLVYL